MKNVPIITKKKGHKAIKTIALCNPMNSSTEHAVACLKRPNVSRSFRSTAMKLAAALR